MEASLELNLILSLSSSCSSVNNYKGLNMENKTVDGELNYVNH